MMREDSGEFTGYRAQHNNARGPFKGGFGMTRPSIAMR